MQRVALRIWLPDTPGVLGTVASGIGRVGGNVTALEVLERDGGIAVDELVVELTGSDPVERMCAELRLIPGVGIEEVRPLHLDAEEHGMAVLRAAVTMMEKARSPRFPEALVSTVAELFETEWVTLVDLAGGHAVVEKGTAPPVNWLVAFAEGACFGETGAGTARSGVLAGALARSKMALCLGRSVAFRERERHEVEMLSRVADSCLTGTRLPVSPR